MPTDVELDQWITDGLARLGTRVNVEPDPTFRSRLQAGANRRSARSSDRRRRRLVLGVAATIAVAGIVSALLVARRDRDRPRLESPTTATSTPPSEPTISVAPTLAVPTPSSGSSVVDEAIAESVTVLPSAPIAGRASPASVWTGSEMIVWGGYRTTASGDAESFHDGAAFDPAAGTWRRISDAPIEPSYAPAAAWTGAEMVVVGANPVGALPALAAAYDPSADRWRVLPPAPLSSEDTMYAIWTGTEVVVLGGVNSDVAGAAYDPSTDSWRSIATGPAHLEPAPIPMLGVWTGSVVLVALQGEEMLPLPSQTLPETTNSGGTLTPIPSTGGANTPRFGAYNPTTDTWTIAAQFDSIVTPVGTPGSSAGPVTAFSRGGSAGVGADGAVIGSIAAAPSSLPNVTGPPVWDGREILVWGGGDAGYALDPSSGSWRSFPAGGLVQRFYSTAVWADGALIAWGGVTTVQTMEPQPDGILYRPPNASALTIPPLSAATTATSTSVAKPEPTNLSVPVPSPSDSVDPMYEADRALYLQPCTAVAGEVVPGPIDGATLVLIDGADHGEPVLGIDDGTPDDRTSADEVSFATTSADHEHFAAIVDHDGPDDVVTSDDNGATWTPLFSAPDADGIALNADGTTLAVSALDGDRATIEVLSDERSTIDLPVGTIGVNAFAFADDTSIIASLELGASRTDATGPSHLYALDLMSGSWSPIVQGEPDQLQLIDSVIVHAGSVIYPALPVSFPGAPSARTWMIGTAGDTQIVPISIPATSMVIGAVGNPGFPVEGGTGALIVATPDADGAYHLIRAATAFFSDGTSVPQPLGCIRPASAPNLTDDPDH